MNGITMNAMPAGLLAKKGAAKPAMRRQSPVQQTGFGAGSSMAGMSGWLTGAEDDCGWNEGMDGWVNRGGDGVDVSGQLMRSVVAATALTSAVS